jgi:hypothetical protein
MTRIPIPEDVDSHIHDLLREIRVLDTRVRDIVTTLRAALNVPEGAQFLEQDGLFFFGELDEDGSKGSG